MTGGQIEGETEVAGVSHRAVYAGFWRRFWAHCIDLTLLSMLAGMFAALSRGNNTVLIVVVFVLIYLVGLTAEGGTPGKRMLGLRVVRLDGARPGVWRAFLRELVGRPLSTIPLWLGYLWMLDHPVRQTWHDRISDTIVVRELPAAAGPSWPEPPAWAR